MAAAVVAARENASLPALVINFFGPAVSSPNLSKFAHEPTIRGGMAELLDELWFIVTGIGDGEDCVPEPGYEKSADQRRDDCESVRALLCSSIDPNVRDQDGAHLLYLALEYDHRHDAEMVRVVVEAGADVNAETHTDARGHWVLDSELWLETEGPHAVANARKRAYLISRGARHSPAAAAAAAEAAAEAAAAERARGAAAKEAEAALERRLEEARRLPPEPSVPSWE